MTLLEVRDASKSYGAVRALDGVSMTVEAGEVVALLGDNGAGKSTLAKAVGGVHRLDAGEIRVDGRPVVMRSPADARRHGIETLHQDLALFDNLSALANFFIGRERRRPRWLGRLALLDTRAMGREWDERLARLEVRIPGAQRDVGVLSGGQRQALTVLMATMVRPSLLLLDEHTAALDPRSAEQVIRLTRRAVSAGSLTTLMVTHSLTEAVQLGDRILLMHRGRVAYDLRDTRRRRLQETDLLQLFDQLRWADRLDESAAEMLRRAYL
jgi:ABC-type sugar transport system ATPase subunit